MSLVVRHGIIWMLRYLLEYLNVWFSTICNVTCDFKDVVLCIISISGIPAISHFTLFALAQFHVTAFAGSIHAPCFQLADFR